MKIHPNFIKQEIEGFGVSGAWWAQAIGCWQKDKRDKILSLLFDPEIGIGLTMYRHNLGGGLREAKDNWRNTFCVMNDDGAVNLDNDKNALTILKEAYALGASKLIAFVNSPPWWMTLSGCAAGQFDGTSNLSKDNYRMFCNYIIKVVTEIEKQLHVPISYISPINEPKWDWNIKKGQEGCHYEPEESAVLVQTLLKAVREHSMSCKVTAVDAEDWESAPIYYNAMYEQNEHGPHNFSIHSYWSNVSDKKKALSLIDRHKIPSLWMSEWTEMEEGRDEGIDSAMVLANVLHDDMTVAHVNSWQYWIGVSKYDYRDGLIYVEEDTRKIVPTKRLWALGNYSRFIKEGWHRIEVHNEQAEIIKISAYINSNASKVAAVAINNSKEAQEVDCCFDLWNASQTVYETSVKNNLALVYSGKQLNKYLLPPQSINTILWSKQN